MQRLGLWANLPRLKAQRRLESLTYRTDVSLTAEDAYRLTLAATENVAQAEAAFNAHRAAELRAGVMPKQ